MLKNMAVLLFLFLAFLCSSVRCYDLTILHTNDVHSRIQEMNAYSGLCTGAQCFGGMARLKTKVDELRTSVNNTLLLDAGDQATGTLWYTYFGLGIIWEFMNRIGYQAMSLGQREFSNGIHDLSIFMTMANFTILGCNIDSKQELSLPSVGKYIKPHHVVTIGNEKIGIIGYTSRNTPIAANTGKLIFNDEITSIKASVATLQGQGVNKIIALGHAGFEMDKRIAAEVPGIDVVVGGQSKTFLYTGTPPSIEVPKGVYPTVITQASGDKVLVVQDFGYAKYLGVLNVTFDENGNVTHYSGNPVLLDHNVDKDTSVQSYIDGRAVELVKFKKSVVGRTVAELKGGIIPECGKGECNLGNLIADSLVHHWLQHARELNGSYPTIAVMNAGGIVTSLPAGDITIGDIVKVQPYHDTLEIIKLQGKYLKEALENSVSTYQDSGPTNGRFLQVSGIRVTYDVNKPVSQRVIDVKVRCSSCPVPQFFPLDENAIYEMIVPDYILLGNDGYSVLRDHAQHPVYYGELDTEIFQEYLKKMSPVFPGLEGRITFVNSTVMTTESPQCVGGAASTTQSLFVTLVTLMLALMTV